MADRILKADIRSAFASFRQAAERLGFDTRMWTLQEPDIAAPWELVAIEYRAIEGSQTVSRSIGSTEFPRYIGSTNREAYDRLTSWSQAMHAVEINRKNGSNAE